MRFAPSEAEAALWRAIRAGKLGVVFRRQVPLLGRYIADFLAAEARLVVEVDGGWHWRRGATDARRDEALRKGGYRVLRLEAELVRCALPVALERIRHAVACGGP
jgi:very-short-patch-repair endonuclease